MLDVAVLIAMGVTAVAFAAGLVVHSGIAYIPALIAAAALYMVMAVILSSDRALNQIGTNDRSFERARRSPRDH
jgi:hypothetical protein